LREVSAHESGNNPAVLFDAADRATVVWSSGHYDLDGLRGARRRANGTFTRPTMLIPPPDPFAGSWMGAWDVIADAEGRRIAVWQPSPDGGQRIPLLFATAGRRGPFGAPSAIADDDRYHLLAGIVGAPSGLAAALWMSHDGRSSPVVEVAVRRPDGGFGPARRVSAPGAHAGSPRHAVDSAGHAVIVWGIIDGYEAVIGEPDGSFGSPQRLASGDGDRPTVDMDGRGNAVAAWISGGQVQVVQYRRDG
jgi:hypothetical protein